MPANFKLTNYVVEMEVFEQNRHINVWKIPRKGYCLVRSPDFKWRSLINSNRSGKNVLKWRFSRLRGLLSYYFWFSEILPARSPIRFQKKFLFRLICTFNKKVTGDSGQKKKHAVYEVVDVEIILKEKQVSGPESLAISKEIFDPPDLNN